MVTKFRTLDEMVTYLKARGVSEARVTGKVATSTSPGGGQVTFRGRLIVSAELEGEEKAAYEERVHRVVSDTGAPTLPTDTKREGDLHAAQTALLGQLKAYRAEYQAVMQSAREAVTRALDMAGITVVEGGD